MGTQFQYKMKKNLHTRIWTWRGPHWWPKASCGKSSGDPPPPSAELFLPPGTGGTARNTTHAKNQSIDCIFVKEKKPDCFIQTSTSIHKHHIHIPCRSPFPIDSDLSVSLSDA